MSNTLISEAAHKKITNILAELSKEYDFNNSSVTDYLNAIISNNNITFIEDDLGDLSGFLEKTNERWVMTINKSDSIYRKIFTIAHELGHFFLHKDQESSFVDGGYASSFARSEETKWAAIEMEANEFAGQLVMPQKKIEEILDKENKEVSRLEIVTIADKLMVSQYAMAVRLSNLGYNV